MIWILMLLQPSFVYFGGSAAYGECSKPVDTMTGYTTEKNASPACSEKLISPPSCSGDHCDNDTDTSGKDDCKRQGCNPTLGCTSGNFYVHHYDSLFLPSWLAQKQEKFVSDDKRVVRNTSECWHPPEWIS